MTYSTTCKGPMFEAYVAPYIELLPKIPSDPPLSLEMDTQYTQQCAFQWRNYLHVLMIKPSYRVSIIQSRTLGKSWCQISRVAPSTDISTLPEISARQGAVSPSNKIRINQERITSTVRISEVELEDSESPEIKEMLADMKKIRDDMQGEKLDKPKRKHASFSMFDKKEEQDEPSDTE